MLILFIGLIYMVLSFFLTLILYFHHSQFTMPPRRSVVDHGAPATSTESMGNGAFQVSGHEEIIIDPVI